jgi:hypothetical protein
MSLLHDEGGLIVLLCSAVLFGVVVLGAVSLWRSTPASGRGPDSDTARMISRVAASAPTDAHMTLSVAGRALRRLIHRLLRL